MGNFWWGLIYFDQFLMNMMQRFAEVTKRKTSLGNIKIKIMVFMEMMIVILTMVMKTMKINIILAQV